MADQHPITPPPELVQQIRDDAVFGGDDQQSYELRLITAAYRAGADQELEACCALMDHWEFDGAFLMECRRTKSPSLKERGLKALDSFEGFTGSLEEVDIIRRAIESLPS